MKTSDSLVFRQAIRTAGAFSAIWRYGSRIASYADRLRGLSRYEWSEDSVPLDAGASQRTVYDSSERCATEHSRGRGEVCPARCGWAQGDSQVIFESDISDRLRMNLPEAVKSSTYSFRAHRGAPHW